MKHSEPKIEDDVAPSKNNLGNETLPASDQTREETGHTPEQATLKPCPFCGKRPEQPHSYSYSAMCVTQDCPLDHMEFLLSAWNRRSATGLEPEPSNEACATALTPNPLEQRIRALEEAEERLDLIKEAIRSWRVGELSDAATVFAISMVAEKVVPTAGDIERSKKLVAEHPEWVIPTNKQQLEGE